MHRLLAYAAIAPARGYVVLCAKCSRIEQPLTDVSTPVNVPTLIGMVLSCKGCGQKGKIDEAIEVDRASSGNGSF